jgi:hypothetical protein
VVDGRGNAYVNNIGFDMMGGEEAAPGIIAVVTPDDALGRHREVAASDQGGDEDEAADLALRAETKKCYHTFHTLGTGGGAFLQRAGMAAPTIGLSD